MSRRILLYGLTLRCGDEMRNADPSFKITNLRGHKCNVGAQY